MVVGQAIFRKMKVALVQMMVGSDKQQNIANAICQIRKARDQGAQLVVLPVKKSSLGRIDT